MLKAIIFLTMIFSFVLNAKDVKITPSEVFKEAVKIEMEIEILNEHFEVKNVIKPEKIDAQLHPRHSFQATYMLLARINDFRDKIGLSLTVEPDIAPSQRLNPNDVYDATQRILTEFYILKKRLGIKKEIETVKDYGNKTPTDVFNKLFESIYAINGLIGKKVNPNHVFSQVMRLKDDIDLILITLNVRDTSVPPIKRVNSKPKDAFAAAGKLMEQINLLQKSVGIKRVELEPFRPKGEIMPLNVYIAIELAIAEIRTIKAHLELFNNITSSSKRYESKTPSDVENVIGWCTNQLNLIKSLSMLGVEK